MKSKNQQGFSILAVILVIVVVVVAIGVWALSGQTNTGNSNNTNIDVQASAIINDASSIKAVYEGLLINGASEANIVFLPNTASTPTAPNVFDPSNGIAYPKVNINTIKASPAANEGIWVYNKANFIAYKIGTAYPDPTILIGGIKDTVCKRINASLHNVNTIPTTFASESTTGATLTNPNSNIEITLDGLVPVIRWTSGCVATTTGADNNFYFRVLKVK